MPPLLWYSCGVYRKIIFYFTNLYVQKKERRRHINNEISEYYRKYIKFLNFIRKQS